MAQAYLLQDDFDRDNHRHRHSKGRLSIFLRKSLSLFVSLLIIIQLLPIVADFKVLAAGTTYYVSNSFGSDTNNGLSPSTPYKSFEKLRNKLLAPGDKVLLRRGDVWNTRLTICANGTSSAWVYVGPYGSLSEPAPKISLNSSRDDICIVAQDLINYAPYNVGLKYLHIDNIIMENSRLGVYFRMTLSSGNEGIKVTNCVFNNIDCPDVFDSIRPYTGNPLQATGALQDIDTELRRSKGNLDYWNGSYQSTGGGQAEYFFPAAIMIGGISGAVNYLNTTSKVSNIEIDNVQMNHVTAGVLSTFYACQSGVDDTQCFNLTKNWRITNVSASGVIAGAIAIDSADGGNPDQSSASYYGIIRNVNITAGHPTRNFVLGTTGSIFQSIKNFVIEKSNFSNVRNNASADGCGMDIENVRNTTIKNNVFANNQGEAMLVATAAAGASKNVLIKDNLFYNNLNYIVLNHYQNDICAWTGSGFYPNVSFQTNRYVSPVNTGGLYNLPIGNIGPDTSGLVETGASIRRNNTLTSLSSEITSKGLNDALNLPVIEQKSNAADVTGIRPKNISEDLWTQTGSFTINDGIITGSGALAWVPSGFLPAPLNMPVSFDLSYSMFVADSYEYSGVYFGTLIAYNSFGDSNGCLFYANKSGIFLFSSSRGLLASVPAASLFSYSINNFNNFRVINNSNGSAQFYVNGQLALSQSDATIPLANGGFLGFNSTTGAGYTAQFKNIAGNFKKPSVAFGTYNVALGSTNIITNIVPGTTLTNFTAGLIINEGSTLTANSLANGNILKTGTTINVLAEGVTTSYNIVIYGDVNSDGVISVADLASIKQHLLKISQFEGVNILAADISKTGTVSITDMLALKRHLIGDAIISQT